MAYSYRMLRKLILDKIAPNHDAVIEGGIGNNFQRFHYFRQYGYRGLYFGVDVKRPNEEIPEGLTYLQADCFDEDSMINYMLGFRVKNPFFVTNAALVDCLLNGSNSYRMVDVVDAMTLICGAQMHLKPLKNFSPRELRKYARTGSHTEDYRKLAEFLEESKRAGWEYYIEGGIVLLNKNNSFPD